MNKRLSQASLVSLALLLGGCGASSSGTPDGGSIAISPSSISVTAPTGSTCSNFAPVSLVVTLRDKNGNLLNNVAFTIDGAPILIDDANNNGVLDATDPVVTEPYLSQTYSFGSKTFFISGSSGLCPSTATTNVSYSTDIGVYSGPLFQKITLSVN